MLIAAMTETCNAYSPMPQRLEDLDQLADKLEDIRHANVTHHQELIAAAAGMGARVIGLGELFPAPYFALSRHELWRGMAEDLAASLTLATLRQTARQHSIVIVAPLYERDGEARFNTAVVIDADGRILGRYRKTHIPQGRNEQGEFDERFYYGPSRGDLGNDPTRASDHPLLPVFDTAVGRIGVDICYDRHFEGVVATLARQGAQLVFSPAVTFGRRSEAMWEMEFEVDAARNNVFIGGSNRRGRETPWNQEFFGRSYFVGPFARCDNVSSHPNLIVAHLDLDQLSGPDPAGWNLQADRRSDLGSP